LYKIIDNNIPSLWNSIVEGFEKKDIYFTYEFFLSSLLVDGGEPILFFYEDENGKVAYPFIKREIPNLKNKVYYDITTPYGYGGPLIQIIGDKEQFLEQFRKKIKSYCEKNDIVSEFIRFHPLLENQMGLDRYLDISYIRNTIYMDLGGSEEQIMKLPGKTRNMVRKAERNGVIIEKINSIENLELFSIIYNSTMDRNEASDYYFFEKKYFHDLIELLDSNIQMFGAYFEGKLISATLIFNYGEFIHYHLSGALREYLNLGTSNLLIQKVAEWGNENGYKTFHLGGGYSGNEDSLYRFKKSFTKTEPLSFYIGKKVHDKEIYQMLVNEKYIKEDNGYFPLYRS
jgi:serine/alanine adding enzyme